MKIKEMYSYLNKIYQFSNQEKWDASGIFHFKDEDIKNVIVCLDITSSVLKHALDNNVNLIISHHPLFINPPSIENFHTRKLVGKLKNHGINVINLHTPFDKSVYGMNNELLKLIDAKNAMKANDDLTVIADIEETKVSKLAKLLMTKLKSDHATYLERYKDRVVTKVAICGGSAAKNMYDIVDEDFDVFITCDVKHHAWVDSIELDLPIISLNHNIENIFVDIISSRIKNLIPESTILKIKSAIKFAYNN